MSFDTIRINELAKELGLTSKEVIEKFAQISVTGKTHSSTVTLDQVKRLKEFIASGGVKETKKPKAFVVKNAKTADSEPEVKEEVKEEKKAAPKTTLPKIEVVNGKVISTKKYRGDFKSVVKKYLSIDVEKLGFLPYDEKVSECVKLLKPYYLRFPDSETVGCIDDIRDQMIAKL